jgi:hypothetical protein
VRSEEDSIQVAHREDDGRPSLVIGAGGSTPRRTEAQSRFDGKVRQNATPADVGKRLRRIADGNTDTISIAQWFSGRCRTVLHGKCLAKPLVRRSELERSLEGWIPEATTCLAAMAVVGTGLDVHGETAVPLRMLLVSTRRERTEEPTLPAGASRRSRVVSLQLGEREPVRPDASGHRNLCSAP